MGDKEKNYFKYMNLCIHIAHQSSRGICKPHVGVLITSPDREVLGTGYKKLDSTGFLRHAERVAIEDALLRPGRIKGSHLYTTLEPRCCELIIEHGIAKVVIGLIDRSVLDHGGVGYLRRHGVLVDIFSDLRHKIIDELMPEGFVPIPFNLYPPPR